MINYFSGNKILLAFFNILDALEYAAVVNFEPRSSLSVSTIHSCLYFNMCNYV